MPATPQRHSPTSETARHLLAGGENEITKVKAPRARESPSRTRDARHVADRVYRVTVESELGDQAALAFAGMAVTRESGKTVLVGPVRDPAQLQDLFRRVSDLGLTLISATAVDEEPRSLP